MRVGEVTKSTHVLKAKDVHIGQNKDKILLILHSSKTHAEFMEPQEIRISATMASPSRQRHFCPFNLIRAYLNVRDGYRSANEQFFIFANGLEVSAAQARSVLKQLLERINVNSDTFNFHSLRIGRSCDLYKWGYSFEFIQRAGQWKSKCCVSIFKKITE